MDHKKFKMVPAGTAAFIAITVAVATTIDNILLAFAGVLIGMLFLFLVRKKTKTVLYDERIKTISGDAARMTYMISTIVFAFLSLMFLMGSKRLENPFIETLGTIFSYAALFNMAVFSICFRYFNQKY